MYFFFWISLRIYKIQKEKKLYLNFLIKLKKYLKKLQVPPLMRYALKHEIFYQEFFEACKIKRKMSNSYYAHIEREFHRKNVSASESKLRGSFLKGDRETSGGPFKVDGPAALRRPV